MTLVEQALHLTKLFDALKYALDVQRHAPNSLLDLSVRIQNRR